MNIGIWIYENGFEYILNILAWNKEYILNISAWNKEYEYMSMDYGVEYERGKYMWERQIEANRHLNVVTH